MGIDEISLKDAVKFVVDNRGKTCPVQDVGMPLISTACIDNERLYPDLQTDRFVSDATFRSWFRSHPEPMDVLLTNKGSKNGQVCLVPDPVDFCIAQDMVALRADEKKITPSYLFAALRSPLIQQRIKALNVDAVIPHFKKTDFDKLFIPCPTTEIQQFVGEQYLSFCRKIELNQKINQTLEEIAKAIFKSWFVDFDPVRAKAEGLPPEISDLFPDELVDSEIGEIPKGWVSCEVRSFVKLNDQSWSKKNHPDSLEYLDLGNIKSNKISEIETYLWDEAPSRARRVLKIGDTIVGTVRPGNRSFGFVQRSGITGSTGFAVLTPLKDEYAEFVYLGVCSDTNIERLAHLADGAAYPAVSNDIILDTSLVEPPPDLVMSFHDLVSPLIQRLEIADQESTLLSELRDTLLPKLISGELRIPDAEKFLEEAGI